MQRLIEEAGIRFRIGQEEETSVEALLVSASDVQKEKDRAFFENGHIHGMKDKIEGEFQEIMGEFQDVRKGSIARAEFMKNLALKFNGFMPEKRAFMEAMADFLFVGPAPDDESFTAWVRMHLLSDTVERLKTDASHKFKEEKLWETL